MSTYLSWDYWQPVWCHLVAWPVLWWGLGGLFLLLSLLVLWRAYHKPLCLYQRQKGSISVMPSALKQMIEHACLQAVGFKPSAIRVTTQRGQLVLKLNLALPQGQSLDTLSEALQKTVHDTLVHTLGVEGVGDIDICVTSIKALKSPSPSSLSKDPLGSGASGNSCL